MDPIIGVFCHNQQALLSLRAQDRKSNARVQAMLKRTKAANKAVLDDVKNSQNTAVTAAGNDFKALALVPHLQSPPFFFFFLPQDLMCSLMKMIMDMFLMKHLLFTKSLLTSTVLLTLLIALLRKEEVTKS